jgi:hypothetical protein
MKALTTAARNRLPRADFALPTSRRFPIPDEGHAKLALQQMDRESPANQALIKAAVKERYPKLAAADKAITHGPVTSGRHNKA